MQDTFVVPLFTPETIHRALEHMRQARPLGDNALRQMVWIHAQLRQRQIYSTIELDVAISEALTRLIEENLTHHRQVEELSVEKALTREAAIEQLKQDFRMFSTELRAWSILYYRYIRLDLGLRVQELSDILNTDSRQLRRHFRHGYRRLAEVITQLEARARHDNRHMWMRLNLPLQPYSTFIARNPEREALYQTLTNPRPPHLTILNGAGGVGKTSLAYVVIQQLIEEDGFEEIVWLPLSTPVARPTLLQSLAVHLGLFHLATELPERIEAGLRVHLYSTSILIVIDDAHHLQDETLIGLLSELIASGHVLLITRLHLAKAHPHHYLYLQPFDQESFTSLLYNEAQERHTTQRHLDEAVVQAIYEAVGGNPLAGRLVVGQLGTLPLERILTNLGSINVEQGQTLFDVLFTTSWEYLPEDARRTAIGIGLLLSDGVTWQEIQDALDLEPNRLDASLTTLVQASFLQALGESPTYSMPSLIRHFVEAMALQSPWNETAIFWLEQATQYSGETDDEINDELIPSARHVLSLLQQRMKMQNQSDELVTLIVENAETIRRSGQWLIWHDLLTHVEERLLERDAPTQHFAPIHKEMGITLRWLGQTDQAQVHLSQAIEIYGQQGKFIEQSIAALELGRLHEFTGQTGPALDAYQRAASTAERYNAYHLRRQALRGLASLALNNHRTEQALELLNQAQSISPDDELDGQLLIMLGKAYLQAGQPLEAVQYYETARNYFDATGDLPELARSYMQLGIAHQQAENMVTAFDYLQRGFNLMRTLGDVLGLSRLLTNMGVVQAESDGQAAAMVIWEEALQLQDQLLDQIGKAYTYYNLADLRWKLGQDVQARSDLQSAYELALQYNLLSLRLHIEGHPLFQE